METGESSHINGIWQGDDHYRQLSECSLALQGLEMENIKGAFGCSGGMRIGMVMVIRMEWKRNTDYILLFGYTFGINS